MRLPAVAMALLMLPLAGALPLVDQGPILFTYEVIEPPGHQRWTSDVKVATHGDKVGLAWVQYDGAIGHRTHLHVQDGAVSARHIMWLHYPAVAFDGAGRFHALSYRPTATGTYAVYVTTYDGQAWSIQQIDEIPSTVLATPSALTHDGTPYFLASIAFGTHKSGRIYELDLSTDEWKIVTTHPDPGNNHQFDIDSQGRIHMVWIRTTAVSGTRWTYSVYDNGTWTDQPVPYPVTWGDQAMAIGPGDLPYFVYTDANRHPRSYAPDGNDIYQDTPIVAQRAVDMRLHVDSEGRQHLLSHNFAMAFDVPGVDNAHYHRKNPGQSWTTQNMMPIYWQFAADMVLDDDEQPVIALPNTTLQTMTGNSNLRETGNVMVARPAARLLPTSL